jgi:hypothetical protein
LTGCQWISLDVTGTDSLEKPNRDNDLQHSMDVLGTPWKVEVERVKGIEPSSVAWEATALPLSYTRKRRCAGVVRALNAAREAAMIPATCAAAITQPPDNV